MLAIFPHLIVHQGGSCIIKKRTTVFAIIRRDLSRASKVPSLVGTAEEFARFVVFMSCAARFFFLTRAFHFAEDRVHREREITPQFFK